jgi:hypothetical protein
VFSDDHHFRGLGAAGNPHVRTLNLDRLAESEVPFTNGIVSNVPLPDVYRVIFSAPHLFHHRRAGILSE